VLEFIPLVGPFMLAILEPLLTDILRRGLDQRRERRGLYVLEQPSRPPFQYRVQYGYAFTAFYSFVAAV
jgi:hypothetical protein